MKIYAVIDTNVIISALLSHYDDVATVQTIKRVISGDIVPIYNDDIINEYLTVLHRPKFGFAESLIADTIKVIINFGISAGSRSDAGSSVPGQALFFTGAEY